MDLSVAAVFFFFFFLNFLCPITCPSSANCPKHALGQITGGVILSATCMITKLRFDTWSQWCAPHIVVLCSDEIFWRYTELCPWLKRPRWQPTIVLHSTVEDTHSRLLISLDYYSLFAWFCHLWGESWSWVQICAHCSVYAVRRSLNCAPISFNSFHASGTDELKQLIRSPDRGSTHK